MGVVGCRGVEDPNYPIHRPSKRGSLVFSLTIMIFSIIDARYYQEVVKRYLQLGRQHKCQAGGRGGFIVSFLLIFFVTHYYLLI